MPCPWQRGTRVALVYALAGPVGVNGIWAAIPIGWFLADAVGYSYYFLRRRALLPGERERERRLIRGIKKSGASSMNCTPFVGQYGMLSNKWGVFICQRQNQIKTKRPEPCAVQDSDRSGRLFLFLSDFWGHFRAGAALLLFYFFRASHYTSLRDAFLPLPRRDCVAAFAAPGSAWPYQWALPHDRPCLPPAPVDGPRQRRWP